MTRRFLSVIGLICVMGMIGVVPNARADQDDVAKVEKLYAEGATLFNAGRYGEALTRFEEAYATYPAANLLFNIARCYEALGKVDQALATFRNFVSQPGVDSGTMSLAERKIKDLEEAKRRGVNAGAGTAAGQGEGEGAGEQAAENAKLSFTPWQWVSIGLGAALVAGGTAFFLIGVGKDDEAENGANAVPRISPVEYQDLKDSAKTNKTIGYIMWSVGGAALITGTVLLVLELTDSDSSTEAQEQKTGEEEKAQVAFGVSPLPGGGAASIGWRF